MRWGIRRYQNKDGSLISAGRKRRSENVIEENTNAEKTTNKTTTAKNIARKTITKGAEITSKLLTASVVDDVFYGGAGKKIAKEAVVQTGRAAVTAYTMARGGYDIKWYDKHGRRVG